MAFVNNVAALLCVAAAGRERWWARIQDGETSERIAFDIANNAKSLGDLGNDGSDFASDGFVLFLIKDRYERVGGGCQWRFGSG